jgi:hypothetical protein
MNRESALSGSSSNGMVGRALIRTPVSDETVPERCGILSSEDGRLVTAQRKWSTALSEVRRAYRPPSLLTLFNWFGLGWYLTVLVSYALLEWQAAMLPVWCRMTIATLMLLGHLYIWHLRRRGNE